MRNGKEKKNREPEGDSKMVDANKIVAYECGEMSPNEVLELFSELIRDGTAWHLQGSYGRQASNLIEQGFIDSKGNILRRFEEDEG